MHAGKSAVCGKVAAVVFACVTALLFLYVQPVFSAEREEAQLFDPDLYLGLATGTYRSAGGEAPDSLIRYYDSTGAFHGEVTGRVEYFTGAFTVIEKGRLLYNYEGDEILILRTEDFREICRYHREDRNAGRIAEGRAHIGVLSEDGSHIVIYDREGQICAELKTEAPAAGDAGEDPAERLQLLLYEPEGYLYVRLSEGEQTLFAALIRDGDVLTAGDGAFPALFSDEQVCGCIGKYLIVRDAADRYTIAGPDGKALYTDVLLHWGEYSWEDCGGMLYARDTADFAAVRAGENWRVLDAALQEAGQITDRDLDRYGHLQYAQGTLIGLPCEDLGDARSTEALTYLRKKVPAAGVTGGWRVAEELGGFLPAPGEGWEVESFSDSFMLVQNADVQRVLRRADGEVLCETDALVFLQNSSFVVEKSFSDPTSETAVYDANGTVLYTSDRHILPCMEDWYYLQRGPWAGVADAEGRWILRELQYDE